MGNTRILRVVVSVGFLLVVSSAFPPPARAAWVNAAGTQFQVGGQLFADYSHALPVPNPSGFADPSCSQGGTSLALVQGRKLAGVDPVLHPLVLVVSCLDNRRHQCGKAQLHQPGRRQGHQADLDDGRAE